MRMPRRSLAVASALLTLSLGAGAAVGATHHAAAKTKAARSHAAKTAKSKTRSGSAQLHAPLVQHVARLVGTDKRSGRSRARRPDERPIVGNEPCEPIATHSFGLAGEGESGHAGPLAWCR